MKIDFLGVAQPLLIAPEWRELPLHFFVNSPFKKKREVAATDHSLRTSDHNSVSGSTSCVEFNKRFVRR